MTLRRRTRLRSNPQTTRAWRDGSRGALAASKDRDRTAHERAVREAVFTRDRHRCQLGGLTDERCRGPLTFHHRRKASSGGAYIVANGATCCLWHNDWIENEPALAREVAPGLVVREGDPEWTSLGRRAAKMGGG